MTTTGDLPSIVDAGSRLLGFDEDTDPSIGPIALGCWRMVGGDVRSARALVETAVEHDVRLVDTADIYGTAFGGAGHGESEEMLGKALRDSPGLRDEIILATKGGIVPGTPRYHDGSAAHLTEACESSLRRLGVDFVDLYQVHRPDVFAHPLEVAEALDGLVADGKVRAIGVSNHSPAQTRALTEYLETPLAAIQPEFSAAHLAPMLDGTLDLAMAEGYAVLAYSPLGRGTLATGEGLRPELVAVLDEIAAREGVGRSAVALAFVLCSPASPVAIVGTQRPDRLVEAVRATEIHLDRSDAYRILEASLGHELR